MLTDILQPTHLIIVLVVALIVLGPKRLPDAGRALGQGLREFRRSITTDPGDNHGPSPATLPSEDRTPLRDISVPERPTVATRPAVSRAPGAGPSEAG